MTKPKKASKKNDNKLSYKDVCIKFLAEGVQALEVMHKKSELSATVARRALRHLTEEYPARAGSFEGWLSGNFPMKGRGRAEPTEGEERIYKVQKIATGGPFLRLPLNPLGVKKGDKMKVTFEKGRVTAVAA